MPNKALGEHYHILVALGFPLVLHEKLPAYTCTTPCLLCDPAPLTDSLETLPRVPSHPPLHQQAPFAWCEDARELGTPEPLADHVKEVARTLAGKAAWRAHCGNKKRL